MHVLARAKIERCLCRLVHVVCIFSLLLLRVLRVRTRHLPKSPRPSLACPAPQNVYCMFVHIHSTVLVLVSYPPPFAFFPRLLRSYVVTQLCAGANKSFGGGGGERTDGRTRTGRREAKTPWNRSTIQVNTAAALSRALPVLNCCLFMGVPLPSLCAMLRREYD